MGKNLDQVPIAEHDGNDGWETVYLCDAQKAAALDEQAADQAGYDRAIRDVVAWLEKFWPSPNVAESIAKAISRGDARGFAGKERP